MKNTPTATATRTAADLEIVYAFGEKIAELERFVDEEFKPAGERLEAAGYPGIGIALGVEDLHPLDDTDLILDELDMVRVANGHPGVAHWLFYRVGFSWNSLDEIRAELEHGADTSAADAVIAFDRKFTDMNPKLGRLISHASRAKSRSENPWNVTEVDGHRISELDADVREAVAKMTGAAESDAS